MLEKMCSKISDKFFSKINDTIFEICVPFMFLLFENNALLEATERILAQRMSIKS